jgi:hypothetical protein
MKYKLFPSAVQKRKQQQDRNNIICVGRKQNFRIFTICEVIKIILPENGGKLMYFE